MHSLSIVIPTYTINERLKVMAARCIASYADQADEIIVCEDGGEFIGNFAVDTYLYFGKNAGFSANVNRGWKVASGDYVAIVSSDTYLVSGVLDDLCVSNKITSPAIENQSIDGMAGCFFVVPKTLLRLFGMLDESMHTYYSDEEYKERIGHNFKKIESVVIHHDQAQTVTDAGRNTSEQSKKDREAYDTVHKLDK